MKLLRNIIFAAVLFFYPNSTIAACGSFYQWQPFYSFHQLRDLVDPLSRSTRDQKELFETETCLKAEADRLNNWWTTRHFELVEQINQTQKTITRVEKLQIEIKQIKEEIEIQKQAIQSLKLIYQSKLLEIPKAYLLVAKKRVDVGAVQKEVERNLHDTCLEFLQINFADHQIKSETRVQNYRVISDFIEDFQGGRAQSFEFDPVVYQDESEILHYIQVFRLYPLFPVENRSSVKRLLESAMDSRESELRRYITGITSLDDSSVLSIIRKQHDTQLQSMLKRVRQINRKSLNKLAEIDKNYFSKISVEDRSLKSLENELRSVLKKIKALPSFAQLQHRLSTYHNELNAHVSNREIIVVTNPSELSHSGAAVTDQYRTILKQAYQSLLERAKESKAYKFYRVESGRLTEADAGKFYSRVEPIEYVMPFFRKTHRKAEGVWRIGIVIGLRVRLSPDGHNPFTTRDTFSDPPQEKNTYRWLIILLFTILIVCCAGLIIFILIYKKKKTGKKQSQKGKSIKPPVAPAKGSLKTEKPGDHPPKHFTNSAGMKFIHLTPGTFTMGSPQKEPERNPEEKQHRVNLTKGFYMGTTAVTVGMWIKFIKNTEFRSEAEIMGKALIRTDKKWQKQKGAFWNNPGFSQTADHPVTCVSYNDALAFIKWLSEKEEKPYNLPTEAQWEFACRAGTVSPFSFGKKLSTAQANYNGKSPLPVKSFKPNAHGLYDMHGNIWEWCRDWHGDYPATDQIDPTGPSTGANRVNRGGSWDSSAGFCRSAYRGGSPPDESSSILGFRIIIQT